MSNRSMTAWLLAVLCVSGCAVGPDYAPQQPAAPDQWNTPLAAGLTAQQQDLQTQQAWWQRLQDPILSDLLTQAAANNLDLQTARSRLRQARALRGISAADLYPSLNVSAGASSRETDSGSTQLYNAGFDAAWEVDLFGGNRRALEAARADVDASEADLRDLTVTLLADVALNYVNVRVFQARLATAEASLANQLDALDLARWRAQSGLVTELDVEQARYAAEQTRAQLPVLRNGLQQTQHRLAVLLGQSPGTLDARLKPQANIPAVPTTLMVGVPADALRQRPDVRRAERQLAAQTARVGEAEAARYPSLNLSGVIGSESPTTDDLFTSVSDVSSLAGTLAMPLLNAGKLRRNVDVQDELRQQSLLNWQTTVLAALEETENALSSYVNEHEHQKTLILATEAAARASELAQQQYESGLVDFQTVLTTQRSYLLLQDDLNQSNGEIVANTIRLYKALGGGWQAGTAAANTGASAP